MTTPKECLELFKQLAEGHSLDLSRVIRELEEQTKEVDYVCPECGSHELYYDATAAWDPELQDMVLVTSYYHVDCAQCEGEITPKEIIFSQ